MKTQKNNWKKDLRNALVEVGNISNRIWQNIDDNLIEHPKQVHSHITKVSILVERR